MSSPGWSRQRCGRAEQATRRFNSANLCAHSLCVANLSRSLLKGLGTVYSTARLSDAWGILTVRGEYAASPGSRIPNLVG
jgi:hypothetical protein